MINDPPPNKKLNNYLGAKSGGNLGEVNKENIPNDMKLINYLGSPGPNMKRNASKARPRPASGGSRGCLFTSDSEPQGAHLD